MFSGILRTHSDEVDLAFRSFGVDKKVTNWTVESTYLISPRSRKISSCMSIVENFIRVLIEKSFSN